MTLLSIIIPSYNSNKNLEKLISNLQVISNIEIIVIDDCGDENIYDVCAESQKLKLIRLDKNSGAGVARNVGLEHSSACFVMFVDADDDILVPELQKVIKDLVYSTSDILFFKPISHTLERDSVSNRHLRYEILIDRYLKFHSDAILYKYHVPWSKIFKRSFLIENNIKFENVSASNDVMFSLNSAILAKNIAVSNDSFYSVCSHNSGLTKQDSVQRLLDRIGVVLRYNSKLKTHSKLKYRTCLIPLLYRLLKLNKHEFIKEIRSFKFQYYDLIPSLYSIFKID